MPGLFVTGTGTDVGKTVVTAGIVRILREAGRDAVPMKPFQTGCTRRRDDGSLDPPDLSFALRIGGYQPPEAEWTDLGPYRYAPPCSPHLAARLAGESPVLQHVVDAAKRLRDRHEWVVAEGAGGVLVPFNSRQTLLDVMAALQWPVVIVAPGGLGTLNATLLTVRALREARVPVFGVVLCEAKPVVPDFIHDDNPGTIQRFGRVRILARLPWLGHQLDDHGVWVRFSEAFDPPIQTWR